MTHAVSIQSSAHFDIKTGITCFRYLEHNAFLTKDFQQEDYSLLKKGADSFSKKSCPYKTIFPPIFLPHCPYSILETIAL
jgi:hypothetical protein